MTQGEGGGRLVNNNGVETNKNRLVVGWTVRVSNPGGGARFFPALQVGAGTHTASHKMGTGSLSWWQSGRGVALTSHPAT